MTQKDDDQIHELMRERDEWRKKAEDAQRIISDSVFARIQELEDRVDRALDTASIFGGIDGSHHKTWVIDQMVRALTGDKYRTWVERVCDGNEGPDTYTWETGIAPLVRKTPESGHPSRYHVVVADTSVSNTYRPRISGAVCVSIRSLFAALLTKRGKRLSGVQSTMLAMKKIRPRAL